MIPFWGNDESLINARSETIASKPAFREAYKKRRCLVLADGFYEWQRVPGGKQPVYIRLHEGRQFAFGGLRERWQEGERRVDSFTIITVEPNEVCAKVHDRMPLILREEDFVAWLDPNASADQLTTLLKHYTATKMEFFPVSKLVNSPDNDTADCVKPIAKPPIDRSARKTTCSPGIAQMIDFCWTNQRQLILI